MTGWLPFGAAFALFFISHTVPVRPQVKARLQAVLGRAGFTIGYSALSLLVLGVLIASARHAPYLQIWVQMPWQRHVVLAGMAAVCVIAALAIGRPNPFSFGGAHDAQFDPRRPGIVRLTRHPLLVALALWAGLHLLPNGDLAHVLMFGVFLAFALMGRLIVDRRKRRLMGPQNWEALLQQTRRAPLISAPATWGGLGARLLAAASVMLILLALHPVLLGVSPLPL